MTALLTMPQREKADAVHLIIRPVTIMLARHRHDDGRGSFRSRTGHGGQGIIFMDRLWRAKGSLPRGQVTQKPVLGRAAKSRIKIRLRRGTGRRIRRNGPGSGRTAGLLPPGTVGHSGFRRACRRSNGAFCFIFILWCQLHATYSPRAVAPERPVPVVPYPCFAVNGHADAAKRRRAGHPFLFGRFP